ncbi:MAG: 7-cyano-7-deazaguanine synthase QueC [Thermoguttaceae bacterium]|nr:7-cyano-7-deazaguanine synthase QueC [Thermoguttaceae bacterium]
MPTTAVVLLSGGLDSTTVCAMASSRGRVIHALTIDYNQRHKAELDAARRTARIFRVKEHLILPIRLDLFGGSSLTDPSIPVETSVPLEKIGQSIPSSYVPARNTVFLSLALAMAETRGAAEIWIGVNAVDYSGYPDCRPEFIDAFQRLARLGTKVGVEGEGIRVVTPLISMSKGQIIREGLALGVDYSQTLTCYSPNEQGQACGKCESCRLRLEGFREAGVEDPAAYVPGAR